MFVISLAMSDLLFSTINLPLTASRYIHEDWKLGVPMCRYFILLSYSNDTVKTIQPAHSGISNFHFLIIGYSRFSFTEMLQHRCSVWWQLQSTGKSENAF